LAASGWTITGREPASAADSAEAARATDASKTVLSPAIDQFQSRSIREDLKRKLESIVAKGRLSTLHDHLNSKQQVKRDQTAKVQAAREFAEAASKIEQLVSKKFQEDALRTGWGIAAGGSIMLSILTVAILIVW